MKTKPKTGNTYFGHAIADMNKIIDKIAKENKLVTKNIPSFDKIKSILFSKDGRDYVTINQKQVLANNMRGVFGGASYEHRNSFAIVHNNSIAISQIKLKEVENILRNYVNSHLYNLEMEKEAERILRRK